MRRKFWLLAAVCLLVCLLAGCGSKEQTVTPDFVLTYADNQPADYPTTQGAERFAALVKERTGGKVVIQVKSGGEYGTEQEVWQQLSIGGIDFARLSLSVLAADLPKLNVLQLPCLYAGVCRAGYGGPELVRRGCSLVLLRQVPPQPGRPAGHDHPGAGRQCGH